MTNTLLTIPSQSNTATSLGETPHQYIYLDITHKVFDDLLAVSRQLNNDMCERAYNISSLPLCLLKFRRSMPNIEARFRRSYEIWEKETSTISSPSKIVNHPEYRNIIALGDEAIPLILGNMKKQYNYWFVALRSITGDDPVTAEDAGNMQAMTDSWLKWGYMHGYITL